jgi:hypothetical protein
MSFAPAAFQSLPRRYDSLANSLNRLGDALAKTVPGNEWEWANGVGSALSHMEAALREHRASAKSPNGALAGVDETRPTLARQAEKLRRDDDHLLTQILGLRQEVRRAAEAFRPPLDGSDNTVVAGEIPDFGSMRHEGEQLLAALRQHKEVEMRLVLDSVNTDIGAGD